MGGFNQTKSWPLLGAIVCMDRPYGLTFPDDSTALCPHRMVGAQMNDELEGISKETVS
jgi:hypothetical protein